MVDNDRSWKWDEGPLGRLIKTCYILQRKQLESLLKPVGLTPTQWSALGVLYHFPGITSSELEHILMIERPSVTSLMNGMEKKQLIVRKDHPEDGRAKQLFLTEAGEQMAAQTLHLAEEVEKQIKEGLTQAEFDSLKSLLIKVGHLLKP